MNKNTKSLLSAFSGLALVAATPLTAQVALDGVGIDPDEVKDVLLEKTAGGPAITSTAGVIIGSGTFSGGVLGDSFSFETIAAHQYDEALADTAIGNNTFAAYIDGLSAGTGSGNLVYYRAGAYGINSSANDDPVTPGFTDNDIERVSQIGEALIWKFDTSGLNPNTALQLTAFAEANLGNASDNHDFVHWSAATGVATLLQDDADFMYDFGTNGPITIANGDILAVAKVDNVGGFRFGPGTYDLVTVPEPSAFALFAGVLALRACAGRRRSKSS